ncbi:LolA family protein [Paraburkholderia flava]|uniref:LolA family protein n=1 Tax=Paraburkholderia flava TaxID=2547393 RepID=UPI0010623429|nr:outer membrane lipoprotein carrier protein LolA [Paraburkholderia flava]
MGALIRALAIVLCAATTVALAAEPAAQKAQTAPATQTTADTALVSQIAAHLAQAKGIRARFTQTQTLSAMKQPLVSHGSLLFFRERGVIWQIDAPYRTTYVITDAGVTEVNAQGRRIDTKNPRGSRGVAQVSGMMRAMLGGDLSALYAQFDVRAQGTPAQWRMQLTPNQPQIAQSLHGLQMEGGAYLQTLHIALANGDATQLDFADTTTVDTPTPAELALFGAR